MNDSVYAYAVANVRAKETELLSRSFFDQLCNAASLENTVSLLIDKGFDEFENTKDVSVALADYMNETWAYLMEIAPQKNALDFLIVKNDFHNLKSIIKGLVTNSDGRGFCIKPSLIDIDELYDIVKSKNFDELPKWMSDTAKKSYELLTSTMDGQIFDMFIDKSSLETMVELSKEGENDFSYKIANAMCAISNLKIAYRISKFSNNDFLIDNAFAECEDFDIYALKKAVLKGREEVVSFFENTFFADIVKHAKTSMAQFEKECDNYILDMLDDAKRTSFGIEPLIAYYFARETEWKNIRIILSVKHAELSSDSIKERMRELYV